MSTKTKQKEEYKPLPLTAITAKEAVETAKVEINRERSNKQLGLKVRWRSMNIAVRKYFRFAQVYLLAGLSGHGKSYLLNEIINDFLDKKGINKDFAGKVLILYFCYEMSASDEVLRTLGSKTKTSYNKILSSHWNSELQTYEGLSDEELQSSFDMLDKIANRPLYYFETAGNLLQLEATVAHYAKLYPKYKLVVAIDHTLLSEKISEKTDIELMANTAKSAIRIKKAFGAMVFMLGQLNNAIEDMKRLTSPAHHYPVKSDIYAQGQLYNACDNVFTIHQPELLKISNYGIGKRPTKNLMHFQVLKARHGKVGSVWLENNLDNGEITEKSFKKVEEIPDE